MHPPKIFISATSGDLRSVRQFVKEALLTINCHPVEQTNFEPDARTVEDMLRAKIGDCQALIHLCGMRYGAEPDLSTLPPDTPRRSYTQMEHHIARQLQEKRGDDHFRVYTFICPEDFPYDAEPDVEPTEKRELQRVHRSRLFEDPHLFENPQTPDDIRLRILALQEQVLALKQEQTAVKTEVLKNRHLGLKAFAVFLIILAGIGVWQWQIKKDTQTVKNDTTAIVTGQTELATQMSQVQQALSRLQQNTDPAKDPISGWTQERLEKELAVQMQFKVEDLRALLTQGKTSIDSLVAGQALLASGKAVEAGQKFDNVIEQEQSAVQRLQQAYEGKAQIAYDKVRYEEALDYRQKITALVDKSTDPLGWALAQLWVASVLDDLARYGEAEPLKREVLRLYEQNLPPTHQNIATALSHLSMLLQNTNRMEEAETLIRRALEIDEVNFGSDHPYVAKDLNILAHLLQLTNRLNEAELLTRRALKIYEASFGPDHPQVAICLNNLAQLLMATNRPEEAEPMMRRALDICEASFGPNHPYVARDLNNLAVLLQDTKRCEEAEPMMRRALMIDEASFGPDHPKVARDLNNLAQLLMATDRLEEAEPLMQRVVLIFERTYGLDHPDVATALNNLANLLQETNRLEEAEPLMRRALKIVEASFGADHPDVAINLNNLATLLKEFNRLEEAESLMRRSISILMLFQKRSGHLHPQTKPFITNYLLLTRAMKLTDAEASSRLEAERQKLGFAANFSGPALVTITDVNVGGQGEALGLKVGDVILRYNGIEITRSEQFIQLISDTKAEVIPLEIQRGDQILKLTAKPGKFMTLLENRQPPATDVAPSK